MITEEAILAGFWCMVGMVHTGRGVGQTKGLTWSPSASTAPLHETKKILSKIFASSHVGRSMQSPRRPMHWPLL